MSWIFKNVIPNLGTITEGPCWNGKELLFSNIAQNRVLSYNPNNNKVYEFTSDTGGANGLNYNKEQENNAERWKRKSRAYYKNHYESCY